LNWALEGLRRVHQRGLVVPATVEAATNEYRAEQDPLMAFFADCCTIKPNLTVSKRALWIEWVEWCKQNGEREGSQRALGTELKRRKFQDSSTGKIREWLGIGIKEPAPPESETPDEPTKEPEKNEDTDTTDTKDTISDKAPKQKTPRGDFLGNTVSCVSCVSSEGESEEKTGESEDF
jgi:putative DNA primase/helicase